MDGWGQRSDAYEKCLNATLSFGYKVFALQAGGWCASASDAEDTYDKYGRSTNCNADGEGGMLANQVYKIKWAGPGELIMLNNKAKRSSVISQ